MNHEQLPNRCDCGCWNRYTGEPYPRLSGPSARALIADPESMLGYTTEEWLVFYEGDDQALAHDRRRARELAAEGGKAFHWTLVDGTVACQHCWDTELPRDLGPNMRAARFEPTRLDCQTCGHKLGPLEVIR